VAVEADGRDDEIGRLAGTVESLRRNAEHLDALRRAQGRRMRRQASLVRAQMTALADTVPPEARGGILAELAEIEATGEALSPDEVAEDTGLIARALERLTTRIGAQQGELQRLVAELREALAAKTALVALSEQLRIARTLQSSMLPTRPPAADGVAVAGVMRAAEEVGGDFYDYFPLADGRLAVAIADVSGKGVPAAIFMAITRTLLRATAALEPEPGRCMARVNAALAEANEQLLFVTMVYGVLDPATGRLTYVNAGHNPPVLMPAAGGGPPLLLAPLGDLCLGVLPDLAFREAELSLAPGDRLFLYTDGLTEGMRADGEAFGTDRLLAALAAGRGLAVEAQAAAAVRAVDAFEAGAVQSDDRTCVILELRGR
jgi:sigma-B regulation protein RsbU (phosphoserine phosphatase)